MKKIIYILFTSIVGGNLAVAQEVSDTTKVHQLEGVVVEGKNMTVDKDGIYAVPTATQRRSSQNGYDLLMRLGIPTLRVSPLNESIETAAGDGVSIFINGMPASRHDVNMMRPQDVLKVEYLESPSDPRYGNALYVVNYVMREYEWGGYTKLSAFEQSPAVRPAVSTSLFSKFSYKKMTFDLFGSWTYVNSHNMGKAGTERYMLRDASSGEFSPVTRTTTLDFTRYINHSLPFTFRAVYNTPNIQISNTIGFTYNETPRSLEDGALSIEPLAGSDYKYSRTQENISRNLSWQGFYFFRLPHHLLLNINTNAAYMHGNGTSVYDTNLSSSDDIYTLTRENGWNARAKATIRKTYGENCAVAAEYQITYSSADVDYFGTSPDAIGQHNLSMYGGLKYIKNWSKTGVSISAGGAWERNETNGQVQNVGYPVAHIYWAYSPSDQHRLKINASFATGTPSSALKSVNVLKQNEFLYITGNPELKSWPHLGIYPGYTWTLSNRFSASAFLNYVRNFNPMQAFYQPYADGNGVIRQIDNSGWSQDFSTGISISYYPIRNLQVQARIRYNNTQISGMVHEHLNSLPWSIDVNYYLNQFYFGAYFADNGKNMSTFDGTIYKSKHYYYISAGWGNNDWNISLMVMNFLRSNWRDDLVMLDTPYYSYKTWDISPNLHYDVRLSVTYTFGYGKPVQRGNEVGAQQGVSSAVLE